MKTNLTEAEKRYALGVISNAALALAKLQQEIIFDFPEGSCNYRANLISFEAASQAAQVVRQIRLIESLLSE